MKWHEEQQQQQQQQQQYMILYIQTYLTHVKYR